MKTISILQQIYLPKNSELGTAVTTKQKVISMETHSLSHKLPVSPSLRLAQTLFQSPQKHHTQS